MLGDFAPKLARVLTEYSVPIQPGDLVIISADVSATPLIEALYEAVLRRGGNPMPWPILSQLDEIFYREAKDDQLDYLNPLHMDMMERVDVLFQVLAPTNTKSTANVDTAIISRRQKARRPYIERYFERINDKSLRWNITAWPTAASAQAAEMGLREYSEFVYRACALDQDDPVAHWQGFRDRQAGLVDWLNGKQHVVVRGPDIDLAFDMDGRVWKNSFGTVNFPDGEIFTSPVETSVNGHVSFNYPTLYGGREVSGVQLQFEGGRVVNASAGKGENYLISQLDVDEGARRLGEFAIGTNWGIQRFTGETLFDEKIGGSVHMALGEAFPELGGQNKSAIHWDMVHSMKNGGEIIVDDELFYRDGQFVVEG